MQTIFLLAARYEGAPLVDSEKVRVDFFSHLSRRVFRDQIENGTIRLPVSRGSSQKAAWLIPLTDLATYLDDAADRARRELARKAM